MKEYITKTLKNSNSRRLRRAFSAGTHDSFPEAVEFQC